MLEVREVPGKGRAVFATRHIYGGEVVLREAPLLLYPQQATAAAFCSHCLRAFNSLDENAEGVSPCSTCGRVGFCSAACAAAAADDPGSHCTAVCRLLAACNTEGLTEEQQSALQLLTRVCSLRAAAAGGGGGGGAAARLAGLASLAAPPGAAAADVSTRELHGRLSHALVAVGAAPAAALSLEEVTALLARDAANGYGIMAPSAPDGERRIRGTGLYSAAAMFNHECLPSVARFDRFNASAAGPGSSAAAPGTNTAVEFRALHDIPEGEEVTQSYFPLPWPLAERQERCKQEYGFQCGCPRCREEATWSEGESDWETDEDAGMAEAAEAAAEAAANGGGGAGGGHACSHSDQHHQHQHQPQAEGEQSGADPAYISLFLLKYVCPRQGCLGTLAPLAECVAAAAAAGGADEAVYECNMCGGRRTEAEFLAELEAAE